MKVVCVYAIISPSGKAYIGSTNNYKSRIATHRSYLIKRKHHCKGLLNASNKYGVDNLNFCIIEECTIGNKIEREQWWLDNHTVRFVSIYNTAKTAAYHPMSQEQKEAVRKRMKGRKRGKEELEKFIKSATGLKRSPEACANIAKGRIGVKFTETAKANMALSQRGKMSKANSSGVVGVSKCSRSDKWVAAIHANGKQNILGRYNTVEEAAERRKQAEIEFWGWHK